MPDETATASGDAQVVGELALEAVLHRPQRQPPGAQHLEHELLLALAEQRLRERDLLHLGHPGSATTSAARRPPPAGCRGWNAYSSESTSASQDASMMFSETPIEPQRIGPVGGVEQDPGDRAGAVVGVEDPDLVVDQLDLGQVRMQLADRVAERAVERVDRAVALGGADVAASRRPRS